MGTRLFVLLARLLLPRDFRAEYGEELRRVVEEQRAEAAASASGPGAIRFWLWQYLALGRAAGRVRENTFDVRGGMTMEGFLYDVKQAARGLARRPGFSALTILTLGLGIGATTAIFSAVHTVVLRPLPYADDERVVVMVRSDLVTAEGEDGVSAANMRDFAASATMFDRVAVAEPWSLDLQVDGRAISLRTWSVTRGFFEAIGAQPLLGRTFADADYAEGARNIVVLGHGLWTNRFNADPDMVGRQLTLDGEALTVVGVMPAEYRFPDAAEAWIPRLPQPWDEGARAAAFMTAVGRLGAGVSLDQARSEADRIASVLRETYPEPNENLAYTITPLRTYLFGDVSTPLFVIMAAVGFVLLIACANVAGLILARGAQRQQDYALRGALGAGTGRLVGHVCAEALILAAAGCLLGIGLTYAGVAAIGALGPDHLPRIDELRVDGTVLLFAVVVAALSAMISGLAPSLQLSRPDLRGALGDGSRGARGSRRDGRARSRLVVSQVAGAVVLLVGAGLLVRSFGVLLTKELGFDPENRLAVQVFAYDYESPAEARTVMNQAIDNMLALPGVRNVAMTTDLPGASDAVIARIDTNVGFSIEGRTPPPAGQEPITGLIQATDGYFETMGIPLLEGRDFSSADDADATRVTIVSETLARRHFGDASPIGERITVRFGRTPQTWEVVGVVGDVRPAGHASPPRPEVYLPLSQIGSGSLTFVVRAESDPGALIMPVMEAIWAANPSQSVYGAATLESLQSEWLKERRFNLLLLSVFSMIALALAAIGIYGLISFSVERRLGELGIRRALGGRDGDLVGMVLGEGARLAAAGLVIGLGAAWYLSRFMQSMLFEVEPTDPLTMGTLGLVVFLMAMLATLVPALRAMRVDPVEALRSE